MIAGPTETTEVNTTGVFGSLAAGTYTIRIDNPEDEGCFTTTDVVVDNAYTPFTFSLSASDICAGTTAGTINVDTTAGSSLPLQIAYWQGAPSAADTSLTYGTSLTYVVPEANFGTWNVRVKDACGEATTQQINMANPYPSNLELTMAGYNNMPTECIADEPNIFLWIRLESASTWVQIGDLPSEGVDIDIYEAAAGDACNLSAATFVETQTLSSATSIDNIYVERNKNLILVMRTPCGQVDTYCYNGVVDQSIYTNAALAQDSCGSAALPDGKVVINSYPGNFMVPPVFHELLDAAGNVIDTITSSEEFHKFTVAYGNTYQIRATDVCGNQALSEVVVSPGVGDSLYITNAFTNTDKCTNEDGKVTLRLTIEGYFPGLNMPEAQIDIISGPDAGLVGERNSPRSFYFYNVTPGATNVIRVINPICGDTAYIDYTVPTYTVPLSQSIVLNANGLCDPTGDGKGTIDYDAFYNGSGYPSVKVYKVGVAAPVFSGPAGTVSLPGEFEVGSYYAEMTIDFISCTPYTLTSNPIEIFPSGSLPIISKKIAMICESPAGDPLEGKLILQLNGYDPYLIEYKLTTDATWTTYEAASDGSEVIGDLIPGQTYNVRATDNCGSIVTEFVTINEFGPVTFENTVQPCEGSAYTIVAPLFANSSYSWKKDGVALSTTANTIVFPSFSSANTGVYECQIIIDGCVIRDMTITMYNELCDTAIAGVNISGNVYNDGNGLKDGMVNGSVTNAGGTLYAALTNAATGVVYGSVPVGADGTYDFTNVPQGEYVVVLTNGKPTGGSVLTSGSLPSGWVNTGENVGSPTATGDDGTIDGKSGIITVTTSNIDQINFAINRLPNSYDEDQHINGAPVVGTLYPLTETLRGSDPEDNAGVEEVWNTNPLIVTSLPTDGFELVYNGVVLALNDTITGYDPALLQIRPTSATPLGTMGTEFTFASVDSAGFRDPTPATYIVTFEIPLPVNLISFNGNNQNCTSVLTWVTSEESNIKEYAVYMSKDGRSYEQVGVVTAKNQAGTNTYHFSMPQSTTESYFKLGIVAVNGANTFSKQVGIEADASCNGSAARIYPNPANSQISVEFEYEVKNATYVIYNALGQQVLTGVLPNRMNEVNVSALPSGNYMVLVNQDKISENFKISISK